MKLQKLNTFLNEDSKHKMCFSLKSDSFYNKIHWKSEFENFMGQEETANSMIIFRSTRQTLVFQNYSLENNPLRNKQYEK